MKTSKIRTFLSCFEQIANLQHVHNEKKRTKQNHSVETHLPTLRDDIGVRPEEREDDSWKLAIMQ